MNTPNLAWKGECGLCALGMDTCLLGQAFAAVATSAEPFLGLVEGCDATAGLGEWGTSTSGTNICTCCSGNAENHSSAGSVVLFISSPHVRDFTSPNPLYCVRFFGPS